MSYILNYLSNVNLLFFYLYFILFKCDNSSKQVAHKLKWCLWLLWISWNCRQSCLCICAYFSFSPWIGLIRPKCQLCWCLGQCGTVEEDMGLRVSKTWLWEKEMATHSSILAWKSPWTEEPGGLQSMGLHDWACVHEGGGRWVGSNKLVNLGEKKNLALNPGSTTY